VEKTTVIALKDRVDQEAFSPLEQVIRKGAQQLLQFAIEEEVAEYIDQHSNVVDMQGHRVVVRNGHLPERELVTGIGPISVQQPRVRDRSGQSTSVDAVIPILYLKGVSTGNFSEALAALLGKDAPGLSATNVVRLKEGWQKDYVQWSKRELSGKKYVYWWADGIYFNVRLDRDRPCMLVIMGALQDGTKELVAIWDGERESKASWLQVLRDLKRQGVTTPPKLAVGDGALGFWAALEEAFPGVREQRCWVHKTANILDKLPKRVQVDAKKLIHEMYMASTREQALDAYGEFVRTYKAKYPKAVE